MADQEELRLIELPRYRNAVSPRHVRLRTPTGALTLAARRAAGGIPQGSPRALGQLAGRRWPRAARKLPLGLHIWRQLFCGLLLVTLHTAALAQQDSFTARIPVAIAAGDFKEAEILIEQAVNIGVVSAAAAAQYRAEIQARERARQKAQGLPAAKDEPGPDRVPPLPYEPDAEPDKNRGKQGRIYVTYTKFNNQTKRTYAGRTSMVIELDKPYRRQAEMAVQQRDKNHHLEDEPPEPMDSAFDPARLDKFDVGTAVDYANRYRDLAYWRIRGREQQLIDYLGGAWSDTGEPHKTENQVRGVSKDNLNGRRFYEAATDEWGKLSEYTGH